MHGLPCLRLHLVALARRCQRPRLTAFLRDIWERRSCSATSLALPHAEKLPPRIPGERPEEAKSLGYLGSSLPGNTGPPPSPRPHGRLLLRYSGHLRQNCFVSPSPPRPSNYHPTSSHPPLVKLARPVLLEWILRALASGLGFSTRYSDGRERYSNKPRLK